jgi:hypothetical protein
MQESTARPVNTPAAILCHLPALQHNVYVEVRIRTTYVFYIMWYRHEYVTKYDAECCLLVMWVVLSCVVSMSLSCVLALSARHVMHTNMWC